MSDDKRRTSRGFRVYDDSIKTRYGILRVQESSLAFQGAHAWLFYDDNGQEHKGKNYPTPQINVASAKQLIAALEFFVKEAEADELTEPAE